MENTNRIPDQNNPNIWIEQKCEAGNLETWRVIKSTNNGIAAENGDIVETITLTKTLLTTTAN